MPVAAFKGSFAGVAALSITDPTAPPIFGVVAFATDVSTFRIVVPPTGFNTAAATFPALLPEPTALAATLDPIDPSTFAPAPTPAPSPALRRAPVSGSSARTRAGATCCCGAASGMSIDSPVGSSSLASGLLLGITQINFSPGLIGSGFSGAGGATGISSDTTT